MNMKLYENSNDLLMKIRTLQEGIINSDEALRQLEDRGISAIEFNSEWGDTTYLQDCHLDEGQKEVVVNLLTSVLQTQISEAEKELAELLGTPETEPFPTMGPDKYIKHKTRGTDPSVF